MSVQVKVAGHVTCACEREEEGEKQESWVGN